MDILIVDDERIAREGLSGMIQKIYPAARVAVFERSDEALLAAEKQSFQIAFLDIMMEPLSGVEMARKLLVSQPKCNVIFTTGFSTFTAEAMEMHASGYITKPVTKKKVERELSFLRYPIEEKVQEGKRLRATCFGNFELFVDGEPPAFAYSKSKEMLAYLIDRRGAACSNNEITSVLGDEEEELGYSYFNRIRSDLIRTLEKAGIQNFVIHSRGGLRIDPGQLECDFFDLLSGKPDAEKKYNGEYMAQYSWAELTNGEIWHKVKKNEK